jgi:methylenetetrahydrofolate dehydrogenase (NADP+)/methenyltetrahydrofolate cyclohydrolase
MPARIIDGKKIAAEIRQEVKQEVSELQKKGITPYLVAVLVGDNPASQIYVRNKAKACAEVSIKSEVLNIPPAISQDELVRVVYELNERKEVCGILVQSPLPAHIGEREIFSAVRADKDVDGFNPFNLGLLLLGKPRFIPATPWGIQELLMRTGYDPTGKNVVIIGRGNIVGKPLAALLSQKARGADATVTLCHSRTHNLIDVTHTADILVAALGYAHFVTKEMVKPGVVVIDVGINRVEDKNSEKGYRIVGDVKFEEVQEVAEAITPVPGGVGPMTVAMLLKNTVKAARMQNGIGD